MDSFPPGMDKEEIGPFVWARYQGFLPAGSQFQPYHLTCSGLSLPMLVYFFSFLGLFLLACDFGGTVPPTC